MQKEYQVTGKNGSRELAKFLAANGQVILRMVELIEVICLRYWADRRWRRCLRYRLPGLRVRFTEAGAVVRSCVTGSRTGS